MIQTVHILVHQPGLHHPVPHPVLLGHQALHLVQHHPQVLFAHILDTKQGQEVAKAVRQVKVIKAHLANRKVKVHPVNQKTEVHQVIQVDKVVKVHLAQLDGVVHRDKEEDNRQDRLVEAAHQVKLVDTVHQDRPEEVVHQDKLDTVIHQGQLEMNTRAFHNQILHHNQNIVHHDGTKGLNKLKLYARH